MCRKILIVDDDEHICRLAQFQLSRAGYRVATAINGLDALDKVRADRPDVIISDLKMPRMHGLELARALKTDEATCEIPVVLMSSDNRDEAKAAAHAVGVAAFMIKPFDLSDLLDAADRT